MSKRILYISYFYPPLGGPAVLRNLKTVKYLSKHGFSVDVITPSDREYLCRDESLQVQQYEVAAPYRQKAGFQALYGDA
jgi:hypothetical protein